VEFVWGRELDRMDIVAADAMNAAAYEVDPPMLARVLPRAHSASLTLLARYDMACHVSHEQHPPFFCPACASSSGPSTTPALAPARPPWLGA